MSGKINDSKISQKGALKESKKAIKGSKKH